jgi:hypothetical protein
MPRGIERRSIDNQHPYQELLARRETHGLSACHALLSRTGTTHIHPTTGPWDESRGPDFFGALI